MRPSSRISPVFRTVRYFALREHRLLLLQTPHPNHLILFWHRRTDIIFVFPHYKKFSFFFSKNNDPVLIDGWKYRTMVSRGALHG